MTREEAKSELMQIYMSLSEEKKQALDVLMAQADGEYIKKSDMIDWLKDIRHKMKPQNYHTASEFEIAENQIWNLIQMLQMGAFPTVAIPSAEPKTVHWIGIDEEPHEVWECDHCGFVIDGSGCIDPYDYRDTYKFCPNCGAKMIEPQESEDKE